MSDRSEIRSLTGLRGIAACFVMAYHFFQSNNVSGPIHNLLMHGYLAVDLFFVLSGFVIAMVYGDVFLNNFSPKAFGGFLVRRIGRVYPLYIVVIVFIAICSSVGLIKPLQLFMLATVSNVLMIQAWGFAQSINGVSWSISTELAAYLLFPLISIVILRGSLIRVAVAAVVSAAALIFISKLDTAEIGQLYGNIRGIRNGPLDIFGEYTIYPIVRCLAGFCLGVMAYRIKGLTITGFGRAADFLAIGLLVLLAFPATDVGVVLLCVPLVVSLGVSDCSYVGRILGTRIIYWLGLTSYSIYLVHRIVDELIFDNLFKIISDLGIPHAFSISKVIIVGIVLLFSAATYYGIESPARNAVGKSIRRQRVMATRAEQ